MTPGDLILTNTGYQLCIKRFVIIDKLPIAVVESMDSEQPFALVVGLRKLPNGRYIWDRATWFSSFPACLYEFDVEKTNKKMERYAI